ncbi:MAG: SLATT domain-containing protein [Bacilli bacterium]|jgi:hypothetical protein
MNRDELLESLRREADCIEEDATYTSKALFNAASSWGGRHYGLGISAIVLSAAAGALATLKHTMPEEIWSVALPLAAVFAAGLTTLVTFLRTADQAAARRELGNALNTLRNDARIFREIDCLTEVSEESLVNRLKQLSHRRGELNARTPGISKRAFDKTRKGIEEGESRYQVDVKKKKDEP